MCRTKGSGEARTSVLSGQVEMMFDAVTTMTYACARRQGARAGDDRPEALQGHAGTADGVGGRRQGLRSDDLAGRDGTGADAAAHVSNRLNGEITKVTTRARYRCQLWEKQGAEALVMSVASSRNT